MDSKGFNSIVEGKFKMPGMRTKEEVLDVLHFFKYDDSYLKKIKRNRNITYKFILFTHDVLIIPFMLILLGLLTDTGSFRGTDITQITLLCIITIVFLAFFPTYDLYSYHRIFSTIKHLVNISKSFFWSLLSSGIIISFYIWPQFLSRHFILIAILFSIGMMLLSRFYYTQLINTIKSVGVAFLIVGALGFIFPDENPIVLANWLIFPAVFFITAVTVMASRCFIVNVVFTIWIRRYFRRQVVVVGSDVEAKNIVNHIIERNAPYWVAGAIGKCNLDVSVQKNCLGELKNFPEIVEENKIDEIIVTDEEIDKRTLISLLDYCTSVGLTVWFPPKYIPIIDKKLYIDNFCDIQLIRLCSQKNTWLFNKIKHALDALIALPLFVLLLPLFLIIAVLIKLSSKGPVFYKAQAVGKNGNIFLMYKFRSMRKNNKKDIHKEYVTKLIQGNVPTGDHKRGPLKITDDPRITAVGRILRKFSLDELPQLINVLKGDMSLVGPRPCLPYEFEIYKDWHKKRTTVRPGITGLWQVTGRSEVAFEDMVLLDLYYIYNGSLAMDFCTLYETIFVVLGKKGAY